MTRGKGGIRVGIVAYEMLKREIEQLTKDDPDIVLDAVLGRIGGRRRD